MGLLVRTGDFLKVLHHAMFVQYLYFLFHSASDPEDKEHMLILPCVLFFTFEKKIFFKVIGRHMC